MRKIARFFLYSFLKIAIQNQWYGLIAWFYSKVIEEITSDGKTVRFPKKLGDGNIVVLVLSAFAFRSDPEYLAASRELRILQIPKHWQLRLYHMFYPPEKTCCFYKHKINRYIDHNDPCFKYKKKHYDFLRGFLPKLYNMLGVSCVISPHYRYNQDIDWGTVSKEIGVHYILINRDSRFNASPYLTKLMMRHFKDLVKFEGTHLVVQSEVDKQLCVDSNFVEPEQISALGCMRMDNFVRRISTLNPVENRRKKVVFFPCAMVNIFGFNYFQDVHVTLARLALNYPDIDIIIKPKPKSFPPWSKCFNKVLEDSEINKEEISNLLILPNINPYELLVKTDVVCGLNTSLLLEAAIAEMPIIIPYFKEIQCSKNRDYIFFRDAFDMFDIAESREEFESLIYERLYNTKVDSNVIEKRKAYFEKHVSSLECDSIKKHVDLIRHIVLEEPYDNVAR